MSTCSLLLLLTLAAPPSLAEKLEPLIAAHQGEVAVAVKHLSSGETFRFRADVPMPTASLIKLPIMIETYRQAGEGKASLDEKITLTQEDKVPGSGILTTHFSPGTEISLRDAVRLMIAYSDNTATNLVLNKIGLPATNTSMEKWELPNTKTHSLVYKGQTTIAPERSKQFGLGSTTADEMLLLLTQLQTRKLVTPEACDEMLGHLRVCEDERISRLLPKQIKVAQKTGSVNAVRTAAGIMDLTGDPIAICVLTANNKDQRWTDENVAELLTSKITLVVYEHFDAARTAQIATLPLRLGSRGERVAALQRQLNSKLKPSPELLEDGEFGPLTKAAVEAFQRDRKLAATGEVSPETQRLLGE